MLLSNEIDLKMSVDEIIDLIKPVINIEIDDASSWRDHFSMSIQSNSYTLVDSRCLFNLIQLIAWKKYCEDKDKDEYKILDQKQLYQRYNCFFESGHFKYRYKEIKKIHFKNFVFLNLYIEKILDITDTISFINSSITISDNDITALKKIRDTNITKSYKFFSVYGPYWSRFKIFGEKYKKHSLEIDFSTSHVTNPDKVLELIDIYNGYFQTILLKDIPVNKTNLWFKKLLCRKWARFKFCISVVVNLCILGTLLPKGGLIWKLFVLLIGGGLSFIIQSIIYNRMINYPETAACSYAKEPFDTNGGVTFK